MPAQLVSVFDRTTLMSPYYAAEMRKKFVAFQWTDTCPVAGCSMRPDVLGELVNGAIPFCGGIYATLLGFRVVGKQPGSNPKYDEWHNRFGGILRVFGPFLVLFGLFLWVSGIVRVSTSDGPPQAEAWKRYTTADGVCSAEFPEPPKQDAKSALGIESGGLTLSLSSLDVYYMLTFSDIPADSPPATNEERLNSIRDNMPAFGAQMGMKYEFVREERISENGIPGRDLEFAAGEKHTFRAKIFILGTRIYRIIAVTRRSEQEDEATRRFLRTFRFESNKK